MNDRFRQGGHFVEAGGFSLDEARAREKLAKYQLADPRRYVLEFVKAAHLLGATGIDFKVSTSQVDIFFDAPLPEAFDLETLASAAFRHRKTATDEGLRHLAIGHNAAGALRLRSFQALPETRDGAAGTAIYLRERLRPGHITAFIAGSRAASPEEELLREYCTHAPARITLNGMLITRPFQMPAGVTLEMSINDEMATGRVGLFSPFQTSTDADTTVTILHQGVLVGRIPSWLRFAHGAVLLHARELNFDLSQSDVVPDLIVDELIYDVVPAAVVTCVTEYLEALGPDGATPQAESYRAFLNEVAFTAEIWEEVSDKHASDLNVSREDLKRHRVTAALAALRAVAREARVFPNATGSAPAFVSIDDATSTTSKGKQRTDFAFGTYEIPGEHPPVLSRRGGDSDRALRWICDLLHDRSDSLNRRAIRERHRAQHYRRPLAPEDLDRRTYPHQRAVEVEGFRVVVGRLGAHDRHATFSNLRLIKTGRLLAEFILLPGDLRGLGIQISGDFEADYVAETCVPSPELAAAAIAAARLIPSVWLHGEPPRVVSSFLKVADAGDIGVARIMNMRHIEPQLRDAMLEGLAEHLEAHPHPTLSPEHVRLMMRQQPRRPQRPLPAKPEPAVPPKPAVPPEPSATEPPQLLHQLRPILHGSALEGQLIAEEHRPGEPICRLNPDRSVVLNLAHPIAQHAASSRDPAALTLLAASLLGRWTAHKIPQRDDSISLHRRDLDGLVKKTTKSIAR